MIDHDTAYFHTGIHYNRNIIIRPVRVDMTEF